MPAQAGIQRLKSLDYRIHPCILPCGPAIGCSNSIQLNLVRLKTCRNDGVLEIIYIQKRRTEIRNKLVIPATNPNGSDLNARSAARRAKSMDGRSNAGIQRLKSLGYEIHPCISSCGPAIGCSNLLQADLVRLKTCRDDE